MREADLQSAIMNLLTVHPKVAWAYVTSSGTVRGRGGHWFTLGKVGLPDIVGQLKGSYGGVLFGIETKMPGKRPTEVQAAFLDMIRANGGRAGWCDSVEGAMEILR